MVTDSEANLMLNVYAVAKVQKNKHRSKRSGTYFPDINIR